MISNRTYTSPNKFFEYVYPHSNAILQFPLKLKRCKPLKVARHATICDVINDVNLFPTVANIRRYPIGRRVTKASALEYSLMWWLSESLWLRRTLTVKRMQIISFHISGNMRRSRMFCQGGGGGEWGEWGKK